MSGSVHPIPGVHDWSQRRQGDWRPPTVAPLLTGRPVPLVHPARQPQSGSDGQRKSRLDGWLLTIAVCLAILAPGLPYREGFPSLNVEDPLIVWLFLRVLLRRGHASRAAQLGPCFRAFALPFLMLTIWITVVSIVHQAPLSVLAVSVATKMKGFLFFVVVLLLCQQESLLRRVVVACVICVVAEVSLLAVQYYGLFDAAGWLTPLYRPEAEARYLRVGARTVGSFGNPNSTAVGLGVLSVFPAALAIFGSNRRSRAAHLAILLVALVGVVAFTRSRTGVAGLLAACAVPAVVGVVRRPTRWRTVVSTLLGGIALSAIFFAYSSDALSSLLDRFALYAGEETFAENLSFATRKASWGALLGEMGADILLGRGIGGITEVVTDSEYVSIIRMGGISSMLMYAAMALRPAAMLAARSRHLDARDPLAGIVLAGMSCAAVLLVCSVGMVFYGNTRLWATYSIALGIGMAAAIPRLGRTEDRYQPAVFRLKETQ